MKNQTHLSSRSEARLGNARSVIRHRGAWPGLLLACCCAVMIGLAHPARGAVTEAWIQRYNGPENHRDDATAVAVDASGNVVVTGRSANESFAPCCPSYDYYTAKYAVADGALLWEKRYNGSLDGQDEARAVAVDGNGNVVVTGSSWGPISNADRNFDYYTAKYAAGDGALLWEQRYNGSLDGQDEARALALDTSGNVVVTGYSDGGASGYTAKYAAADGALLWQKHYDAGGERDQAQAVALDGSGNVVVTGVSYHYTNNYANEDYYTAKYAAANGALLWEKRYNGPANGGDVAQAVAVDGSGNVVVTGISYNGTDSDYYTAKYAAADGALLWEQRYNGPANSDDQARALAVDRSGNVVVTGTSHNGTNDDYYTAKYAAADGTLLWEKRFNGPANGDDAVNTSHSLALGPNGMVAVTGSSSRDYATVVYLENLPPVSIDLVPTGVRIRFNGVPGRSYNIKRAPAVTGPWSTLATPTAPLDGLIEYVDTTAPAGSAFYRTSAP